MCPYFCDINDRNCTFCMYVKGPTMWQRLERKISFLNCLFVYFFLFLPSAFLVFFLLLFLLSAFFYPHFPIHIRHPQVSGPRFTDTHFSPKTIK